MVNGRSNRAGVGAIMKAFAVAVLALSVAAPAAATQTTFDWSGTCLDCLSSGQSPATGTLVLKDYVPGTALVDANFVSFDYHAGYDLHYDLSYTQLNYKLSGVLGTTPGPYDFGLNVTEFNVYPVVFFATHSDGSWSLGGHGLFGRGTDSVWTPAAVPESASWLTMLTGFGLIGARLRRRRTNASFA